MSDRIILGTANFNKRYGLIGKNLFSDTKEVLDIAKKKGISTIDFAPKYTRNKKVLKSIANIKFKIISKLPSIKKIPNNKLKKFINREIKKNLSIFKTNSIYCILFHDSNDFKIEKSKKALNILYEYKKKNIIKKIGVSVYNPNEIKIILNKFQPYKPDIIQLPFNIFDNRFETSGILKKLKKLKISVHARSIFLKGLVFKDSKNLPKYFNKWKKPISKFQKNKNDNLIYNICFNYVYMQKNIDKIIVGFKFKNEILNFFNSIKKLNIKILKKIKPINDEKLVNPSFWTI
jgi:hypothetical protein